MKECLLELTRGAKTVLYQCDLRFVYMYNWYYSTRGYAETNCRATRKNLKMHRLIMQPPTGMVIDHINSDPLDNRRDNLRICTQTENARNSKHQQRTKSGLRGVYWSNKDRKWTARINTGGKFRSLGYFNNKIDAAVAFDTAARELYGTYAKLNFPIKEGP